MYTLVPSSTDFELLEWVAGDTSTTYLAVQSNAVFDYEDANNPNHVLSVSVRSADPTGRSVVTNFQVCSGLDSSVLLTQSTPCLHKCRHTPRHNEYTSERTRSFSLGMLSQC